MNRLLPAACMALLLGGCEPAIIKTGMPLTTVIHAPDGTETVMTGRIMPKMTYASTFTLADASGRTCDGVFSPMGVGSMTCSDGLTMPLTVSKSQYGKPSGAYTEIQDGTGVAVGWGDKSDAAVLRAMF